MCAVVAVGALVAGHNTTARDQGPAVRRGPSHPALVFPDVYAGSVVSGQVAGFGRQTRSTTLQWPAGERLALVLQCSAAGGYVDISTGAGSGNLDTACAGPGPNMIDDAATYFPDVEPGSQVTLTVTVTGPVTGPWAVAVLNRDPRWLHGGTPAQMFQGRHLQHWVSGGISGSMSTRLTAADARPAFVLTCGQPGRLTLLLNGQDVGAIRCADATWSQQVLPVSTQSLAAAGYLPGRTSTIGFGWEGSTWAYVGAAQYGG